MIEVIYNSVPSGSNGVVRVYEKGKELTSTPKEYPFVTISNVGENLVLKDSFGKDIGIIGVFDNKPLFRFNDGLEDLP